MKASKVLDAFTNTYGAGSVRVYEHILFHHIMGVQTKQTVPLGQFSNQLVERSHHDKKEIMAHHSFNNGSRRTKTGLKKNVAVAEIMKRDLLIKTLTL